MPKVRDFLERKAFGETVNLSEKAMVKAIATSVAQYVTVKTFAAALRALVVEELVPRLEGEGRPLSGTEPFPFSRPTFEASKTIFNLVAADDNVDRDFAHFLQDATDVRAFAKLPQRFGFAIEYTDRHDQSPVLRARLCGRRLRRHSPLDRDQGAARTSTSPTRTERR